MEKKIGILQEILANSYALYLKTQNYHWNIEGEEFLSLHNLFEQQYTELATAIDNIAEVIRALGYKAYGSFSKYKEITKIEDGDENYSKAEMLKDLITSQHQMQTILHDALKSFEDDEYVIDLIIGRITVHKKAIWMLESSYK